MLGTDLGALADKRAPPDSVVLREDIEPVAGPFVAGVQVVPLSQRDGRRSTEQRVQSINRTGRVTQQAIDAHAELLIGLQLLGGLEVLLVQGFFYLANDPGFRLTEF